ncbi:hypothetical protein TNCV_2323791 [Trichonephila clavipes]|nr:hypothetical protein TNCV_2323791 [Trichonephila clavipes]
MWLWYTKFDKGITGVRDEKRSGRQSELHIQTDEKTPVKLLYPYRYQSSTNHPDMIPGVLVNFYCTDEKKYFENQC